MKRISLLWNCSVSTVKYEFNIYIFYRKYLCLKKYIKLLQYLPLVNFLY